ncbi:MAG TPA: polysaccharide deacetylase [Actinomycetota bacterium]|nr:polysaccharide deacetylase [Actinomycetota bacterium]
MVAWPDGRRAAFAVTFDMDAEAAVLAIDERYSRRPSIVSHQQYGPVTAVPRLLALTAELDIRCSFFVPGFSAERHPATVAQLADAGHEVGHHGYLHRPPGLIEAAAEREELERGIEALERVAGMRPTVYRAPWWETSEATFDLLVEHGFTADSSLFDRDEPYRLSVGEGELVEVPVSWALDDWEKYAFLPDPPTGSGVIEPPARVLETWWEELEAYVEVGGCCVLTMHPFLSGRPSRARALRTLLERAKGIDGLWIATIGEIAAHIAKVEPAARTLSLPSVGPGPAEPVPGT